MSRLAFLFRTDVHAADKSPDSWKGDYPGEIWANLEQIGVLAQKHQVAAVLDGGDFFHVKAPTRNSHGLVAKVARIHAAYPCPVWSIEGNHDMAYNQLDTIERQPLGVLYDSGVFKNLREEVFGSVRVIGVPFVPDRGLEYLRALKKKPGDTKLIAIVHALAGKNPPGHVEDFFGEPVFRYRDLVFDDGPDVWCFPPGTPVLDGCYRPIPIETVTEHLEVLGRGHDLVHVEAVHPARQVAEDLVRLDIEGVPPLVTGSTQEHPYWVVQGLSCVLPSRSDRRCHPDMLRTSYPCNKCASAPHVEATWVAAGKIAAGDFVALPVPKIPVGAPSDPGLARLLGYYAAEGHIITNHNGEPVAGVAWSFHAKETDLHADVTNLVKQHFDLDTKIHPAGDNCVQLCAYGKEIAEFFTEHAGRYSDQKSLSTWIFGRSAMDRAEFLVGWMLGDGHVRSGKVEVLGATASRTLAFQAFFLALSIGLRPYFTIRPPKAHQNHPCHVISFYGDDGDLLTRRLGICPPPRSKTKVAGFFSDGLYYVRVRETSRWRYEGPVHNFRTNTGEYVAGGVLVHNCFGHWHKDQGIEVLDGRWFVNQGAVSRGALVRENLERTPKVALIEIDGPDLNVTSIPLKVAPSSEVFDLARKERRDKEGEIIERFVRRLEEDAKFDPSASIEESVQGLDFAPDVRALALSYLERAREE